MAGPLVPEVRRALERLLRTDDVCRVAVMPDVHLAEEVCVGTVVATRKLLYPDAVGGDIGCGMAALRFECGAEILASPEEAARLLSGLHRAAPPIRHPRLTARERLPEDLEREPLSELCLERLKARDGRVEFATLGRGNHFLEFQSDDEGALWLMVHSGSRAFGQAIRARHLERASAASTGLRFLDADSPQGQAYLSDVHWACRYAEESRRALAAAAAGLCEELWGIRADPSSFIGCRHNLVRRESHFGEELWVHRKGAISARAGEPGIIPGSMGTPSFHVEGRGCERSLSSSSHGAGRHLSRGAALKVISTGRLHREMQGVWFDHRLAHRLRDEAPSAYKDIGEVLRAQRELTRVVRRLRPILSYKSA